MISSDDPEYYGLEIKPIKGKLPDYQRKKRVRKERQKSRSLRQKKRRRITV